jgi:gliding motility-associated-like protein
VLFCLFFTVLFHLPIAVLKTGLSIFGKYNNRMRVSVVFTLVFLFAITFAFSQQETTNWYFGKNAGIKFVNGQLIFQPGKSEVIEGTAVMSDSAGNLLFYTNGITVWDKTHSVMEDGTGLYAGSGSSTQAALIVPHPGNHNQFYIFTSYEDNVAYPFFFHYSVVDISLNNGNGKVIEKNTRLFTGYGQEKVAGIKHKNGKDFWVVTNKWLQQGYQVFQINERGLNRNPVHQVVGKVPEYYDLRGYMKFSPDGRKLAVSFPTTHVEVYDFDASTGQITNPIKIPKYTSQYSCGPYGIEFSCDSKLIYISEVNDCVEVDGFSLLQYNISSSNEETIKQSRVILEESAKGVKETAGALQMGPDGKIYIAFVNSEYIGAIQKPGVSGKGCGYVKKFFKLPGEARSLAGLPNFVQSYFNAPADFGFSNNCNDKNVQFKVLSAAHDSVKWNFGDAMSGVNNRSVLPSPSHQYSKPGNYSVELIVFGNCRTDTIVKLVQAGGKPGIFGTDTSICANDSMVLITPDEAQSIKWQNGSPDKQFVVKNGGQYSVQIQIGQCSFADTINVSEKPLPVLSDVRDTAVCKEKFPLVIGDSIAGTKYLWGNGSTAAYLSVVTPGSYQLMAQKDGCTAEKTIEVKQLPAPAFSLGNDTSFCQGSSLQIQQGSADFSYRWQDGLTGLARTFSQPGLYAVIAENNFGCVTKDSILISIRPLPVFDLGSDTTLCDSGKLDIDLFGLGDSYIWQNNSTGPDFTVMQAGLYHVTVSKNGCTKKDSITVFTAQKPSPDLGPDLEICPGAELRLNPGSSGQLVWDNGTTASTLLVTKAGVYTVTATNSCGSSSDRIVINDGACEVYIPNAFTPNGDGKNDTFKPTGVSQPEEFEMRIFSRWGELIFRTRSLAEGWNGISKGELLPAGNYVYTFKYRNNSGKAVYKTGTVTLIR